MRTASVCAYNARRSEQTTREMASIARSWAEGTDGEVRKGDEVNNSKYHSLQSWKYAELARKYCEKIEQAGYKTRGSYDDTVTYDYPDIVFYDGSSYVAKKETMGNAPENNSEYWQIFASGLRGTIDYRDLENKPKINGKVLSGDDGLADLGIMQPDWSESDDASNAFIQNKPDLKAVATSGKYTDLEGRPELKEVATSGSYNDLKDRPTIPSTAKNGRLIIQRNGAEIQTFTADQGTDATANILVPTISSSAAITQTGQMALDAIEKNASIEGTLAYQIAQQNGNFGGMTFGIDADGNYGYVKRGADTVIPFSIASNFDSRCMFCSVNCASNIWESVWTDQGQIFASARIFDIILSKMSIIYTSSGSNIILRIKALSTGVYRFGYTGLGIVSSNEMQVKEQLYNAGEYIFNDSYDVSRITGNRACYCEFIK